MQLELTEPEAAGYLTGILVVLQGVTDALLAAAELEAHDASWRLPEGMLRSLESSRESLDTRFQEVYAALHGYYTKEHGSEVCRRPSEEGLGPQELQ